MAPATSGARLRSALWITITCFVYQNKLDSTIAQTAPTRLHRPNLRTLQRRGPPLPESRSSGTHPPPSMSHPAPPLRVALFGRPGLTRRPPVPTLTDQAARWADHVLATGTLPAEYVTRKALDAVAFSFEHGLRALAVPSKLVGVKAHQHAVEALSLYDQLPVEDRPRLVVSHGLQVHALRSDRSLQPVGRVQPKHAAWLAPLLGHGVALHLHAVTGLDRRAQGLPVTLGVNVRLTGLDLALASLDLASQRAEADAPHLTLVHTSHVAEPPAGYSAGGGGGEPTALAVRLWRDADGTARMSVPHVVRHSPSGPEWGYGGSGPADCARSVLLAFTDEATADAHYQAFKVDIIAHLPDHGGVLQRSAVLAWLHGRALPALAA